MNYIIAMSKVDRYGAPHGKAQPPITYSHWTYTWDGPGTHPLVTVFDSKGVEAARIYGQQARHLVNKLNDGVDINEAMKALGLPDNSRRIGGSA
jgi:hypothetical protein